MTDIMADAIAKVIKEYEETWGRKPYVFELEAVFNFVMGPIRDGRSRHGLPGYAPGLDVAPDEGGMAD